MGLHKEGEIIMASPGKRRRKKADPEVAPAPEPVVVEELPPAPKKKTKKSK